MGWMDPDASRMVHRGSADGDPHQDRAAAMNISPLFSEHSGYGVHSSGKTGATMEKQYRQIIPDNARKKARSLADFRAKKKEQL